MKNLKIIKKINMFFMIIFYIFTGSLHAVEIERKEYQKIIDNNIIWQENITYHVIKDKTLIANKINNQIQELIYRFRCTPRAQFDFITKPMYKKNPFISFKYNTSYMCRTMPHIDSYDGGITFNYLTGNKVILENEIKNKYLLQKLANKVLKKAKLAIRNIDTEDKQRCSSPYFSKEFYLNSDNIVFTNFFKDHYSDFCEVDIKIPLRELLVFLKKTSQLRPEKNKKTNCKNSKTLDLYCSELFYQKEDKKLNIVYKKLKNKLNKKEKKLLLNAQRAWLKLRDNQCKLIASKIDKISRQISINKCLKYITTDRYKELEKILDEI